MIKPKPLQAPVEGGFTVDDFTVGEQGTVTCPAGHTVALSRTRIATFGVAWPGLPAARTVHHLQDRPQARPARTR